MRDNTSGPVRGDRTEARPGGSPVPTFSAPEQTLPGNQRRIDDTAARREPLTEPVPAAGRGIPQQTSAAQTQQTQQTQQLERPEQAGTAVPKQDDRKTEQRDDKPHQAKAEQLDGAPIPAPTDEQAGAHAKQDTAKPDHAKPTNGKQGADDTTVLFGEDAATGFRTRWRELQADFVDDPKRAVEGADKLVDEVLHSLTETLTKQKQGLAGGWQDRGETEELRQALRKYRSFLDQLLKT